MKNEKADLVSALLFICAIFIKNKKITIKNIYVLCIEMIV